MAHWAFFPEIFDWWTFVHIVHTNLLLCHHWSRPAIIDFVVVFFYEFSSHTLLKHDLFSLTTAYQLDLASKPCQYLFPARQFQHVTDGYRQVMRGQKNWTWEDCFFSDEIFLSVINIFWDNFLRQRQLVVHCPGVFWYLGNKRTLTKITDRGKMNILNLGKAEIFTSPAPSGWKLSPTGFP